MEEDNVLTHNMNEVDDTDGEALVERDKPGIVEEEGVNTHNAIRVDDVGDKIHTSSCNDPAVVINATIVLDDNCQPEEATNAGENTVISFTNMNTSIVNEVVPSPVKVLPPAIDDIFVPSHTHTDVVSEKVSTSHEQLEANADINTSHIAIVSDTELVDLDDSLKRMYDEVFDVGGIVNISPRISVALTETNMNNDLNNNLKTKLRIVSSPLETVSENVFDFKLATSPSNPNLIQEVTDAPNRSTSSSHSNAQQPVITHNSISTGCSKCESLKEVIGVLETNIQQQNYCENCISRS